jgi:hypothetical protein
MKRQRVTVPVSKVGKPWPEEPRNFNFIRDLLGNCRYDYLLLEMSIAGARMGPESLLAYRSFLRHLI